MNHRTFAIYDPNRYLVAVFFDHSIAQRFYQNQCSEFCTMKEFAGRVLPERILK